MANPVLQFLEKLSPKEQDYQVFAIEEKEKVEKSALNMAHLKVVLTIVNRVCHDLAKWLSHYLFFFSRLTTQGWSVRKYHVTKCHRVTVSQITVR